MREDRVLARISRSSDKHMLAGRVPMQRREKMFDSAQYTTSCVVYEDHHHAVASADHNCRLSEEFKSSDDFENCSWKHEEIV